MIGKIVLANVRPIPYILSARKQTLRKDGQTMEKKVEFESLDHKTQVEIVRLLMTFDECHIEHACGETHVTPNYCLCATYPDDYWLSQNFKHSDFDFDGFNCVAWDNVTQNWDDMPLEQRFAMRDRFEKISDLFIELVIQKYLFKKGK